MDKRTMKKFFKPLASKKGQSATEFLLMSFLVLFFVFVFVQMAIAMVTSHYFQYVSFMAARVNLVQADRATAEQEVKKVIDTMIGKKFGPFAQITNPDNYIVDQGTKEAGVQIRYRVPMFIPFVKLSSNGAEKIADNAGELESQKSLELEVESRLGKELACPATMYCDNGK